MRDFIVPASRADVYTTSASASNVSVYTNTICVAKRLLGNTQTPELHPVDAGCFKQIKREKLFYFLRNSPYSHSANADIIALYLLVSSNREEKVS